VHLTPTVDLSAAHASPCSWVLCCETRSARDTYGRHHYLSRSTSGSVSASDAYGRPKCITRSTMQLGAWLRIKECTGDLRSTSLPLSYLYPTSHYRILVLPSLLRLLIDACICTCIYTLPSTRSTVTAPPSDRCMHLHMHLHTTVYSFYRHCSTF
jgi:hypothetical protein